MKTRNFRALVLASAVGLTAASCDLAKDVSYTVEPCPLEMHGDSVAVTIKATVGEKGLHKKAVADITPMLMWDGGEKAMKTITVQGYKAAGNGTVIPKEGKTVTYTDKIAYQPGMKTSELKIKLVAKKGSKDKEMMSDKICDGVITTSDLVISDDRVCLGKDNFTRTTQESVKGEINYLVNSSNVRGGELKDQDIKDMQAFIMGNAENPKVAFKTLAIEAYASPEGEITKNDNLANERAETAGKAVHGLFKKKAAEKGTALADNLVGKGEDWEGFKAKVLASDIPDKDLIIRVLEMYTDKNKREEEIKNMAQTYLQLKKEILPALRRSQISLNYDLIGKSDAELTALAKSNPDSLNEEELLFSATLTQDVNEQLRIYREFSRIYPNDWRGPNNVGYCLMMQNNLKDAGTEFEKAANLEQTAVVSNNLGVVARLKGDRVKAMEYYNAAAGAPCDVNYNKGIINIQDGKYPEAVGNFGSENTLNVALAKMLNGDNDGAMRALDAAPNKDTAEGYYLKAVLSARMSNQDGVINSLKSAIAKDASMKEKAMKDLEFMKWFDAIGAL